MLPRIICFVFNQSGKCSNISLCYSGAIVINHACSFVLASNKSSHYY
jgi:hypothetical protein